MKSVLTCPHCQHHQLTDGVPDDHCDHNCNDEPCQRRKRNDVVPFSDLKVEMFDQEAHYSIVQNNFGYNARQEQTDAMFQLGRPELILLLIIEGALLVKDPRQRKVMLMVLLASVIITAVLPASFVVVMAASLATIAVLGITDLLKRA